jgi:hypothetical protein
MVAGLAVTLFLARVPPRKGAPGAPRPVPTTGRQA